MITVDNPIPLMPHSDSRLTWAKYGHHILYSSIIPTNDSVAEVDIANQTNGYPLGAMLNSEMQQTTGPHYNQMKPRKTKRQKKQIT